MYKCTRCGAKRARKYCQPCSTEELLLITVPEGWVPGTPTHVGVDLAKGPDESVGGGGEFGGGGASGSFDSGDSGGES